MKSMTGFGRATVKDAEHSCTAEVRTVNHRYCDISLKLPRHLQEYESDLRRRLAATFARGSVTLTIALDGKEDDPGLPVLNHEVASRYIAILKDLARGRGLTGEIDVNTLAGLPEFFAWDADHRGRKKTWAMVERAVDKAATQAEQGRRREGAALSRECRRGLAQVKKLLGKIEARAPRRAQVIKRRYQERVKTLAGEAIDPARMAQEIAVLADRLDFSEECVRLHAHTDQFLQVMNEDVPVGRRLNFLLQEMGREANTIGSKAGDPEISMMTVAVKEEIEKLREQVQNLE